MEAAEILRQRTDCRQEKVEPMESKICRACDYGIEEYVLLKTTDGIEVPICDQCLRMAVQRIINAPPEAIGPWSKKLQPAILRELEIQ